MQRFGYWEVTWIRAYGAEKIDVLSFSMQNLEGFGDLEVHIMENY